jgi:hypothetical protein
VEGGDGLLRCLRRCCSLYDSPHDSKLYVSLHGPSLELTERSLTRCVAPTSPPPPPLIFYDLHISCVSRCD